MSPIPEEGSQLIALLKRKLELKGLSEELRILSAAKTDFVEEGYDNWNGGQYYYTLYVDVPIELFVEIEDQVTHYEKVIYKEISSLKRGESSEHIRGVTIRSAADIEFSASSFMSTGEAIIPAFWDKDRFRLFISHTNSIKDVAFKLKIANIKYYITSFIAHEDIEPTKEWQLEIEKALASMDAIVALITPEFNSSKWCDQEVGIAMGMNRLVIPIRMGYDPYGFFGKYQGLAAQKKTVDQISNEIFTILVKHDITKFRMASLLVERLLISNTYAESKTLIDYLERVPMITSDMGEKMLQAVKDNDQVRGSFYVPSRINRLLVRHGHQKTT
jgi:hypothetical protein